MKDNIFYNNKYKEGDILCVIIKMIELSKEIYQEFYSNILDNFTLKNGSITEDNNTITLLNDVKITNNDEFEIIWPDQTTYKGMI